MKTKNIVMIMILMAASLSACGPCATDINRTQIVSSPQPQVVNLQEYNQCTLRNPNYYGSPAWYAWVNNCKLRYGVTTQGYPPFISVQAAQEALGL